jgi:putative NIF3 family GTP cyclohydrolase 1 type 2
VGKADVDLILTGELSHHEILAALGRGTSVITVGHWNSEHGYLYTMQNNLTTALVREGERYEVLISQKDISPFVTL